MMTIKEHAIMTALVLTIMLGFIAAGEASEIEIPEVVDHDMQMSEWEVQGICQEYVEQVQKPCSVIKIDDRICYAKMELDGSSKPVQCFERKDQEKQ